MPLFRAGIARRAPYTPQVATQLVVITQPAGAVDGVNFTTQPVLQVQDAFGNIVNNSSALVTVAKLSGAGTLSGTLTAMAVFGVVTFADLRITGTGAHTLRFTAASLTQVDSTSFTVGAAAATQLAITTQPGGAVDATVFTTQPVVEVRNSSNGLVTGSTASVTVAKLSGSGTLSGTLTKAAVGGVVTFTDLKITGTGPHTLRFTSAGLTQADSSSFTVDAAVNPNFPLTISADSRWVQRPNGSKFNVNGEAAWSLFAETTQATATTYLADRAAKGVNLLLCNLIEKFYTNNSPAPRNANGDLPFTGTVSGEEDFTTPNTAYWNHVDWIINKAAENGIVVMALPCYVGSDHDNDGWAAEITANGTTRMATYGTFLGNRYASFPNIIWCMGGDDAPVFGASNVTAHFNALANAIKAVDTVHLMTAHPHSNHSSFEDYNQPWLDLNLSYPDTRAEVHKETRIARQQVVKPVIMAEADYGNEDGGLGPITALDVRMEMYQGVLGGAFGHIYGNAPTWYFGTDGTNPGEAFADTLGLNYASVFNSFEADKLLYVANLFAGRDLSSLTPDYAHTKVTAGYDTGGVEGTSYCPVMASSQVLVAYMRNGSASPLTVNKAQFVSATFNVRWYNPRTGSTSNQTTASFGAGSQVFTAPDANDWVLLLDDVALNLPSIDVFAAPDIASYDFEASSLGALAKPATVGPYTNDGGSGYSASIITDPTAGSVFGGGKVLQQRFQGNNNPPSDINGALFYFANSTTRMQLGRTRYWRAWLVIPSGTPQFLAPSTCLRKWYYLRSDSKVGFVVINSFGPTLKIEWSDNGTDIAPQTIKTLALDTLYKIELQVTANSVNSASDGIFRVWINGVLEYQNLAVKLTSNSEAAGWFLDQWQIVGTQREGDGVTGGSFDEFRYWDKVALSTQRIGPG